MEPSSSSSSSVAQSSSSSLPYEHHAEVLLQKLEEVREIRDKTLELEELQAEIEAELAVQEREEAALAEYRRELRLLQQEKMAHVEELRLVQQDIHTMEETAAGCEADLGRARHRAASLYQARYQPLREDVEGRRAALGLSRLPQARLGPPEGSNSKEAGQPTTAFRQPLSLVSPAAPPTSLPQPSAAHKADGRAKAAAAAAAAAVAAVAGGGGGGSASLGFGGFRQQPPPMKSCLSCHQQIHRNAPICPLCKAKSRSRHPKKPKPSKSSK